MANTVLFIIVLLVAVVASALAVYFAVGLNNAKKDDDRTATSKKAIQTLCQPTQFKETCEESMASSNSSDPKELIRTEFKATVAEIKNLVENSKTVKELQADENTKEAFRTCQELFDWSIQDLERSFDKLGEYDMQKIGEILLTLQVWLSGVLTSQQTCIDSYVEMNGEAAEKMRSIMTKAQELSRNGLTILNGLSSITKELNIPNIGNIDAGGVQRRLLLEKKSEFPEWMSYSDRKLLQAKTEDLTPTMVVAKDGSGKYDSIAKAVAEIPRKNAKRVVIHIKEGVYTERIDIPRSMTHVMLIGDGPTKTIITNSVSVNKTKPKPTTFHTATVSATGMNFIAKDIGFENSIGPDGHQAVALRASGDMAAFYNCHFNGYQDTLYAHAGRQFYRDCTITGTIDFIFGDARAVFQNCLLLVRKPMENQNCICIAQGRQLPESKGGYVLQNCTFSGDKDYLPLKDKNLSYLNRPWRAYATVIIMQSQIDDIIQPLGYVPMNGDKGLETSFYVEFENRGPGSKTDGRAKWGGIKKLDLAAIKQFTPRIYLESETWIPQIGIPIIPDMVTGV
ncbi:hypothetical protein like AT5G27870 [Hibiscus trionum]|uniref:Pectinesterase n=1 Tax=Hibiscus trionum TaxID=183268 RepID=A0A9W7H7A5_HIBTR|nr:hypothetical protein like AT5G27870 [Hibiscus trionum]